MRVALPTIVVCVSLGVLARLLDHGPNVGLGREALETVGRVYVALLLLAPLVIVPLAYRAGAPLRLRVLLSLIPGFLWWLTEIGVRLRWHSLPESIWLVHSPFNAFHLWVTAAAIVVAEAACRLVARERLRVRAPLLALGGLVLGLAAIAPLLPAYLFGYRALFQSDLLPMPRSHPGALAAGAVATAPPQAPNIVFILSDDHRHDFSGYEGHPFIETPALDRLAEEGVNFARAYVTSSLCSPSRASFLTGTYPHRHGVWNNFTPWSDENRTFLEYLKPAGYRTAFIGKWHMPGELPDLRGVDHFVTFTNMGGQGTYEWCPLVVDGKEEPSKVRYIAEELTDRAIEWIERNPEQRFALYLSHKSVHADFTPDSAEAGRYADAEPELPDGAHPWTHLTKAQYTHFNFNPLDDAVRRYGEAITSMDRHIGRLLDRLDALGLAENTLVIYTSDNGYQWGERGLVDKRWPYEDSIRVPFLVRWPAAAHAAGTRVEALIGNIDVAPAVLAAAGIEKPAEMQGESWLPLLADPEATWRDAFLYSYYFEPPYPTPTSHALVTADYKLITYDGLPAELYDLAADPEELRNLANSSEHAQVGAELERGLSVLRSAVEQ